MHVLKCIFAFAAPLETDPGNAGPFPDAYSQKTFVINQMISNQLTHSEAGALGAPLVPGVCPPGVM